MSCRGKSRVSGVTTARVAPTLSNSSFAAWRAYSSAVQNGHQPPRKKLRTRVGCGAAARRSGDGRRRLAGGIWRGVSDLQRVRCHVCVAQPAHEWHPVGGAERRQQLGANLGECLVGLVWHRLGVVRLRIDWLEAGWPPACVSWSCGRARHLRERCVRHSPVGTSTDQSRSRATLTKASSAGE